MRIAEHVDVAAPPVDRLGAGLRPRARAGLLRRRHPLGVRRRAAPGPRRALPDADAGRLGRGRRADRDRRVRARARPRLDVDHRHRPARPLAAARGDARVHARRAALAVRRRRRRDLSAGSRSRSARRSCAGTSSARSQQLKRAVEHEQVRAEAAAAAPRGYVTAMSCSAAQALTSRPSSAAASMSGNWSGVQAKTGAPSAATSAASAVVVGGRAVVGEREQDDQAHAGPDQARGAAQHRLGVAALVEVGDQDQHGLGRVVDERLAVRRAPGRCRCRRRAGCRTAPRPGRRAPRSGRRSRCRRRSPACRASAARRATRRARPRGRREPAIEPLWSSARISSAASERFLRACPTSRSGITVRCSGW